jgi:hypothetical protein
VIKTNSRRLLNLEATLEADSFLGGEGRRGVKSPNFNFYHHTVFPYLKNVFPNISEFYIWLKIKLF